MELFRLIGRLAGWEMRRLARRGTAMRVRMILVYTLFLLFIAFAAYTFRPSAQEVFATNPTHLSPHTLTDFAEQFALWFMLVQLVAVILITPAIAALAVAEEKERHELPLLLTTTLTDREIVFGKAVGRIAFVLLAVFAGLPVLMLTLFFGGVSFGLLAAGYALTGGTVVLCAAIGMNTACQTADLRSALLRTYGRTALFVCVLVPLFAFVERGSTGGLLVAGCVFPLVQVAVAVVLLVAAARALRLREATAGPRPATAFPEPPRPAEPPLLQPPRVPARQLPPVDDANPVLWKERCVGWRPEWSAPGVAKVLGTLAAVLAVLLFVWGAWNVMTSAAKTLDPEGAERLGRQPDILSRSGWLLVAASMIAAGRYLIPLTIGVSGTIAGERRRGTLDLLLSTTLNRWIILWAKVRAHAERGLGFVAVAVAALGMAFIVNGGLKLGLAAVALTASGIVFVIGLSAWLSVRCASDVQALRLMQPVTVLVLVWPAGVWYLLSAESDIPAEAVMRSLFVAAGVCTVLGLAFWWRAGARLNRGE